MEGAGGSTEELGGAPGKHFEVVLCPHPAQRRVNSLTAASDYLYGCLVMLFVSWFMRRLYSWTTRAQLLILERSR